MTFQGDGVIFWKTRWPKDIWNIAKRYASRQFANTNYNTNNITKEIFAGNFRRWGLSVTFLEFAGIYVCRSKENFADAVKTQFSQERIFADDQFKRNFREEKLALHIKHKNF